MNEIEVKYPALKKHREFRKAVIAGDYIIANEYLDDGIYAEKADELERKPLILISRKAVERTLRPGKVAAEHGETLEGNIRYLVGCYEKNRIIHGMFWSESGELAEASFDTCLYGSWQTGIILEITDSWEWQEREEEAEAEEETLRQMCELLAM